LVTCGPSVIRADATRGDAPPGANGFEEADMKDGIHPNYAETKIICLCGNEIVTRSTAGPEIHTEICSACHPFYTGQQKIVDTAGRVERFKRRYDKKK
jgi:large subunit ribosomal protein L31